MRRLVALLLLLASPVAARPLPVLRLAVPFLGDVVRAIPPASGGGGGGGVSFTDSAGLRSALSDETGTGVAVFATSPLFTTSIDINSTGTTITESAAGKIAVEGVDVLTQTNTISGITNKTFTAPVLGAATATSIDINSTSTTLSESAAGWLAVEGNNLVKGNTQQITIAGPSAARTYTVPDASVTLAQLGANTFTAAQFIDGSADAVQLTVQANATQTAQAFVVEDSTGTDMFTVSNIGTTVSTGAFTALRVTVGAGGYFSPLNRSVLSSSADGIFEIQNNSQNGFTRLNFGGTTSSFPAIARSTTGFQVQLADGTAGGFIKSSAFIATGSAPAVSNTTANSCGTTAASIAGTDHTGIITVGAGAGTSCTLAFTTAATTRRQCWCSNETTLGNLCNTHYTDTTHSNVVGTFVAGDVVNYGCLTY